MTIALRNILRQLPSLLLIALGGTLALSSLSIYSHVFLVPLPVGGAQDLYGLALVRPEGMDRKIPSVLAASLSQARGIDSAAYFEKSKCTIGVSGKLTSLPCQRISRTYFETLALRSETGRSISIGAEELRTGAFVSSRLCRQLWKSNLCEGQAFVVDGKARVVATVVPQAFQGIDPTDPVDLFIPDESLDMKLAYVILRVSSGSTLQHLNGYLPSLALSHLAEQGLIAPLNAAIRIQVESASRGWGDAPGDRSKSQFDVMLAMTFILLAISLLDASFLSLLHAVRDRDRISIKIALGASLQVQMRELVVHAVLGSALSVSLALACTPAVSAFGLRLALGAGFQQRPESISIASHWLVTLGIALLSCISLAFGPCLILLREYCRPSITTRLSSSPRYSRIALAAAIPAGVQILFTCVLGYWAICSGLEFSHIGARTLGYQLELLYAININMLDGEARKANISAVRTYKELLAVVRQVPGVENATYSVSGLFGARTLYSKVWFDGISDPEGDAVHFMVVGPEFFRTTGLQLHEGRDFGEQDTVHVPLVAIANRTFQNRFGSRAAVGETFHFGRASNRPHRIIGIAANAKHGNVREARYPILYVPLSQWDDYERLDILLGLSDSKGLDAVIAAISRYDRNLLPSNVQTVKDQFDAAVRTERLLMTSTGAFAILSFAASAMGIFSIFGFLCRTQRKEILIRSWLGASNWLACYEQMRVVLVVVIAFIAIGAVLSAFTGHLFRSALPSLGAVATRYVLPGLLSTVFTLGIALILFRASRIVGASKIQRM